MPPPTAVVVGDSVLEVTVAPTEPMRHGDDALARIGVAPGGQGANVAVRLARRGIGVRLVTGIGADAAGRLVGEAIEADGVTIHAMAVDRTGVVVSLLGPGGGRTMLSNRVAFESLEAAGLEDVLARAAEGASWLHASGYLLRGPRCEEVAGWLRHAAGAAARVSLAGGSVPPGTEAEHVRGALAVLQPDMLVLARAEAAAVVGADAPDDLVELAQALAGLAGIVIVTAGEEGSAVARDRTVAAVAAAPDERPAVDSTGAGDAYVAALIAKLISRPWPADDVDVDAAVLAASRAGAAAARVWGSQGLIADER